MRTSTREALCVFVAFAGACATRAVHQPADSGKVTVGVTTMGSPSPSTFRLTIEPAGIAGEVKSDAGVFINDNVPAGEHVVHLALPSNCRADKGAERTITVSQQRRSAVLRFEVRCS
jgi:hypothetical protein